MPEDSMISYFLTVPNNLMCRKWVLAAYQGMPSFPPLSLVLRLNGASQMRCKYGSFVLASPLTATTNGVT